MTQDEALMRLYESLSRARGKDAHTVREMTEEDRRAYMREAKRRSRERQRQACDGGSPMPTTAAVRDALADAGIMILASDAPGADLVRNALAGAFEGRSGVPLTVEQRVRSGSLKPKLIRVSKTA